MSQFVRHQISRIQLKFVNNTPIDVCLGDVRSKLLSLISDKKMHKILVLKRQEYLSGITDLILIAGNDQKDIKALENGYLNSLTQIEFRGFIIPSLFKHEYFYGQALH